MDHFEFERYTYKYVVPIFPIINIQDIPEVVIDTFDRKSKGLGLTGRLNDPKKGSLCMNLMKLDLTNYFKKDRTKYKFLNEGFDAEIQIFMFEFVTAHNTFLGHREPYDYDGAGIETWLFVYHETTNSIIARIEGREFIQNLSDIDYQAFTGYIRTEEGYQRKGFGTFMLRVMALYVKSMRGKKYYSGTILSPEMLALCRYHVKNKKWMIREDYFNSYVNEMKERYLIEPVILSKKTRKEVC